KAGKIVRYILTTLLMLVMIYPFIYLVLNSFAAWDQVDKKLIPTEFTTRSWDWLFGNSVVAAPAPWIHAFINTIIVSTIATGLMLLFGLMV
ncbi:carbohydrate ABC transporter permease, partial [Staphylococcus aureus]|nr:carbohydrate ABC transporter permease [Staphylococcus aureus]